MTHQLPEQTRPEACLSDLAIERFLVGEPPDHSGAPTETHLLTCERCQRRRDELAAAPEQVPDQLWWQQQTATAPRRRQMRSVLGLGGGAVTLAAAAALVLAVRTKPFAPVHPIPTSPTAPAAPETRPKGGDFMLDVVARHSDGKTEHVFEDTVLHPRDRIQFIVTSLTSGHVAVVGLDAARSVSVYFPDQGASPAPFPSGTHELPVSIILDDTLGPERIVTLLCPTPPDPAVLVRAGRNALANMTPAGAGLPEGLALNDPSLPLSCRQTAITIHKEREGR